MDIIDVLILGPDSYLLIMGLVVLTLPLWIYWYARKESKPNKRFDELMKKPKFAEKQRDKIQIDSQSNLIKLRCFVEFDDDDTEEWLISNEMITIKNCRIKRTDVEIPFYKISELLLTKVRKSWYWGDIGFMYIWFEKPPRWHKIPLIGLFAIISKSRRLIFKPFYENEVLEVKRRYDEYIKPIKE